MAHAEAIELIKHGGLVVRLLLRRVHISPLTGKQIIIEKSSELNDSITFISVENGYEPIEPYSNQQSIWQYSTLCPLRV